MSDNDRAAKAARAKALLAKKRQQKKAADSVSGAITPSVSGSPAIPARTLSPAPSEASFPPPPQNDDSGKRDIADVFGHAEDDSWISSLPRATSPPSRVTSTSPRLPSKPPTPLIAAAGRLAERLISPGPNETPLQDRITLLETLNGELQAETRRLQALLDAFSHTESLLQEEKSRADNWQKKHAEMEKEKETLLAAERRTISLLVTEKAALTAELEKREDTGSKLEAAEELLHSERARLEDLEHRLHASRSEADNANENIHQYQIKEKELVEKTRDLERQLQLSTIAATESRKEAEDANRRLQELTEQIQTDDRVERLEQSLKHSQDHADELEFQLSKLRQSQAALKSKKDELAAQCQKLQSDEGNSQTALTNLEGQLEDHRAKYEQVSKERETLAQEARELREQSGAEQKTISELQEKLVQASSVVATHTRQMQVLQNELKSAVRRAEQSEKTTRNLQLEGTNLMRSLDEMRPKIVELTDAKLDLAEKVERLERSLADRDATIGRLEASLEGLQNENGEAGTKWQETLSRKDRDHQTLQTNFSELQKGYEQLQEELDATLASLKTLEAQRADHHQDSAHRIEEIVRLTSVIEGQSEELSNVRHELQARWDAQEDEQRLLESAQNEIESLRSELDAKDDEIDRHREAASRNSSPSRANAGPRSLDAEMVSSLRQQHALDLSNAQSTIRALEDTVFEGEGKIHALQKQVASLQERLQSASRGQPPRSFSPSIPSRPSSRAANDVRRSSFGMNRPSVNIVPPPPLSRTVFDQVLSPQTMHKRKVSLSMLKARIDSEVSAATAVSHPPSRALSPVHSHSGSEEDEEDNDDHNSSQGGHQHPSHPVIHRPQFLDESHVFWCHSCQGDLVIL